MARSRHSTEWKRVVFMASAGGVSFRQVRQVSLHNGRHTPALWEAYVPGRTQPIVKASKYDAAAAAVLMMAETEFLPDAAKAAAPANGADELRSST